jgi:hypothetical protein
VRRPQIDDEAPRDAPHDVPAAGGTEVDQDGAAGRPSPPEMR